MLLERVLCNCIVLRIYCNRMRTFYSGCGAERHAQITGSGFYTLIRFV